jgi:purine-binding chemotaxis protein CheW
MTRQSYLLFELNHSPYGITADAIQEIFLLPALTDIAHAGADIAGILSLRGEILTVIDLNQRLGKPPRPLSVHHSVIVIQVAGEHLGLIVDLVHGVEQIPSEQVSTHFMNGNSPQSGGVLLFTGLAQYEEQLIPFLNPQALLNPQTAAVVKTLEDSDLNGGALKNGHGGDTSLEHLPDVAPNSSASQGFLDAFSPAEREILEARAKNLRHAPDGDSSTGLLPLAVVGLKGEYFGLNLERIHEFTEIHQITPIPCCPPHVVGNINLRGEILTLLDISQVLQLKGDQDSDEGAFSHAQQAVVVRLDNLVAGITVNAVHDVVYLHASEVAPVPAAVHAMNEDFIRGVASYQEKQMSILDLSKILKSETLVVDEAV